MCGFHFVANVRACDWCSVYSDNLTRGSLVRVNKSAKHRERNVCRFEAAAWGRGALRDSGPSGCEGDYPIAEVKPIRPGLRIKETTAVAFRNVRKLNVNIQAGCLESPALYRCTIKDRRKLKSIRSLLEMENDESMGDGTEMYKLIQLRDQTETVSVNK